MQKEIMELDINFTLFIYKNKVIKDNTGISNKAKQKVNVKCLLCNYEFTAMKDFFAKNNYECRRCHNSDEILSIVKMLNIDNNNHLRSKEELIDLKCPDCNIVYRKTYGIVLRDVKLKDNPCKKCNPAKRTKNGILFLANYPEIGERIIPPLKEDIYAYTVDRYNFKMNCGHVEEKQPIMMINSKNPFCSTCDSNISEEEKELKRKIRRRVKPEDRKQRKHEEELSHLVQETATCSLCGKDHTLRAINLLSNIKKNNNEYVCQYCSRKNPPFAPIFDTWDKITWSDKNTKSPEDLTTGSAYRSILECNKGHEWDAFVYALLKSPNPGDCPRCYSPSSSGERELQEFIRSLGIDIVCNDRSVIKPLELDVFIPEKNIAIEYNGDYWHSVSAGTDRSAHFNKWKQCDGKNVRLLTVWDSDWHSNKDCVKSFIRGELGVDSENVFSGDFSVSIVGDLSIVEEFFNTYCIRGFKSADLYIGAFDKNGELLAVSSWIIEDNGDIILNNFVSSFSFLVSCLREMLSHVFSLFPQYSRVFTVLDNVTHNSKLYEELGFVKIKDLEPNYFYYWNGSHYSKNYFTLNHFQDHDELLYASDLSIQELMETNSIHKIYDYGKTLWEYSYN